MSTISFNVVAHDLASRTFNKIGRSALAMAAKIKAADGATARVGAHADRSSTTFKRLRVSVDGASLAYARFNNIANKLTGGGLRPHARLWFRAIAAGLLTFPSLVAPAVVALGALAGGLVSVVPGAVALSGAMLGVFARIKQVAKGTREGTPALRRAADALEDVKRSWQGFLDNTQARVAPIFTQLFRGASEVLPRLIPMTNRFAQVFSNFLRGVRREMRSPAFAQALGWLKKIGAVSFRNLLQSGENLVKFFYNLARAFDSAGVDVSFNWLNDLTKSMNRWAKSLKNSEGFQEFVDFAKREWPKLRDIASNLGRVLGNMFQGFKPISSNALTALERLTAAMAKITPGQWTAIGYAFVGLSVGVKALGLAIGTIKGIGTFLTLLKALDSFGGKGGGGAHRAGGKFRSIGNGLLHLGKGLRNVTLGGLGITALMQAFDKFGFANNGTAGGKNLSGRMPPILNQIMPWLKKTFGGLGDLSGKQLKKVFTLTFRVVGLQGLRIARTTLAALPRVARLAASRFRTLLTTAFRVVGNAAATGMARMRQRVASGMTRVVGRVAAGMGRMAQRAGNGMARMAARVAGGMGRVVGRVRNGMNRMATLVGNGAARMVTRMNRGVARMALRIAGGMGRMVQRVGNGMGRMATRVANGMSRMQQRVSNGVARMAARLSAGVGRMVQRLGNGMSRMVSRVRNGMSRIRSAMSRAASAMRSAAGRMANALASAASRIAGIVSRIVGALGRIRGAAGAAASAIGGVISRAASVPSGLVGKLLGRAAGGPVKRNTPYVVGEKGPELFMPNTSGRIIPNHKLPGLASSGGGSRAGGGGGDTYIVKVYGATDPVATGREVQKALLALKRNNGGRSLGLA